MAALISALAATTAAILAAANLIVSGRRESRKWTREVLIDTLSHFLDQAYAATKDAEAIRQARTDGSRELAKAIEAGAANRQAMISAMSRLRLLADQDTVTRANELRAAVKDLLAAAAAEPFTDEKLHDAKSAVTRGIESFIPAARRSIHV